MSGSLELMTEVQAFKYNSRVFPDTHVDHVWRMRDREQSCLDISRRWDYEERKKIHRSRLKTQSKIDAFEIEQERIAMEYLSK